MAAQGPPILFCCRGVAGCEFAHWRDDQRLSDVVSVCFEHGSILVQREAEDNGTEMPDVHETIGEAGVNLVVAAHLEVALSPGKDAAEPPPPAKKPRAVRGEEALAQHWLQLAEAAPAFTMPLLASPMELKSLLAKQGVEKLPNVLPSATGSIADSCLRNIMNARLGTWTRDMISWQGKDKETRQPASFAGILSFNSATTEEAFSKVGSWAELAARREIELRGRLTEPAEPARDYLSVPLTDEVARQVVTEAACGDLQLNKHSTFGVYFPKSTHAQSTKSVTINATVGYAVGNVLASQCLVRLIS